MTFSICAREELENNGRTSYRFGVAVTTRRPTIGSRCPFVSSEAAVATQSVTNPSIGRKGLEYVQDGLGLEDAITALLNADPNASERQVHGVSREETFAFSGEDCPEWYGHRSGDEYTVAGNTLASEEVIRAVATEFEAGNPNEALAKRLIQSLRAGYEEGGDKRYDREIQSAAVRVWTEDQGSFPALYNDLRVDATETPIEDIATTYEKARHGAGE